MNPTHVLIVTVLAITPVALCDVGEPLLLTPLIRSGQISEAIKQSAVNQSAFPGTPNITSYSGYITTNNASNSRLFSWIFLSQNDSRNDPIILWLPGRPGGSSLNGLFIGNGPYAVNANLSLSYRPRSLINNHNVIYIDCPVGSGFSFTNGGFVKNQTQVGNDLYEALQQILLMLPELRDNPLFVAGESYAGHYAPAVCHTIHQRNPAAGNLSINLRGLAIGNGLLDIKYQVDYSSFLYNLGFIDEHGVEALNVEHRRMIRAIQRNNFTAGTAGLLSLRREVANLTGIANRFNYLDLDPMPPTYFADFLSQESVRSAIHIGNSTFNAQTREVMAALYNDLSMSISSWLVELLANYRVLLYCGQFDTAYPCSQLVNYIENLNFAGKNEYPEAIRRIWSVQNGNDIAGYTKTAGNLTEIVMRNSGAQTFRDQPDWSLEMYDKFIRGVSIGH